MEGISFLEIKPKKSSANNSHKQVRRQAQHCAGRLVAHACGVFKSIFGQSGQPFLVRSTFN
jgi:4'-phosphopantetheinyl transferase EntD